MQVEQVVGEHGVGELLSELRRAHDTERCLRNVNLLTLRYYRDEREGRGRETASRASCLLCVTTITNVLALVQK